ncbi:MAG: alpha/beta hydrolase [Chloroflexi bacterium]|nr:alpha/beta hydrolase [Chloroflexota bacterium]
MVRHRTPAKFEEMRGQFFNHYGVSPLYRNLELSGSGRRIHYLEMGEGKPVVLIHGIGLNGSVTWAPILAKLGACTHVLAPDLPGFGLSTKVDFSNVDDKLGYFVDFLLEFLDSQGIERASLVGSSLGGGIALSFALTHPDRVEKLLLEGAPMGLNLKIPLPFRLMAVPGVNRWLQKAIALHKELNPTPAPFLFVHPERVPREWFILEAIALNLPDALPSCRGLLEGSISLRGLHPSYYLRPRLPEIPHPTLFIWGDQDLWESIESGREAQQTMPNAGLFPVLEAGHLPRFEHPDLVAGAMIDFLDGRIREGIPGKDRRKPSNVHPETVRSKRPPSYWSVRPESQGQG